MTTLIIQQSADGNMYGVYPNGDKPVANANLVAHRVTGTAPLHVSFNAIDTVMPKNYSDQHYLWTYGDAGSGTHINSGESRNFDAGPVVGHVFETAGTFTVTLDIYDFQMNLLSQQTVDITVDDPDVVFSGTNTICISQTGTFTGAPAGAQLITASTDDANTEIQLYVASNKRILLNKGEVWSTTNFDTYTGTNSILNTAGFTNVTFGAYGSGNIPKFVGADRGAGNYTFFTLGDFYSNVNEDIKVTELELACEYFTPVSDPSNGWLPVRARGRSNNALIHKCIISKSVTWFHNNEFLHMLDTPPGTEFTKGFCISQCVCTQPDPVTGYGLGVFFHGTDISLIDNNMSSVGTQMIRLNYGRRVFYGHCELRNDNLPSARNIYKISALHAEDVWFANDKTLAETMYINVYANNWQWSNGQNYPISGGRTNTSASNFDVNSRFLLWHGNYIRNLTSNSNGQGLASFEHFDGCMRNNIIDLSDYESSNFTLISYTNIGNSSNGNPLATRMQVYNNTIVEFSTTGSGITNIATIGFLATNDRLVKISNNGWYFATQPSNIISPDRVLTEGGGIFSTDDPAYDTTVNAKGNIKFSSNPFVSLSSQGLKFSDYELTDDSIAGADVTTRYGKIRVTDYARL